jgi:hypothetical protein
MKTIEKYMCIVCGEKERRVNRSFILGKDIPNPPLKLI